MVPHQPVVVIVSISTLVARLAHPAPEPPHGLVLGRPRQLDLVHGVFLAKQPPALAAIHGAVEGAKRFLAHGVEADVIEGGPLPMGTSYGEIWVSVLGAGVSVFDGGEGGECRWGGVVGLEDIEAFKFLVQHGDGLEGFGLQHAFAEPGADVVLFDFLDFSVEIVEMAIQMSALP